MSAEDMHRQAHQRWNNLGRLPLSQWLSDKFSDEDAARLKAIGNCVMPRVARLALHVHLHEQMRRYESEYFIRSF